MLSLLFVKLGHNTDNEYILNIHPSIFSCLTNLLAGWHTRRTCKIQKGPKWATTPVSHLLQFFNLKLPESSLNEGKMTQLFYICNKLYKVNV